MFESENHHETDKKPPQFTTSVQDQNPGARNSAVVPQTLAINFGN
ncbi:hypothetical protein [Mycobacterium leprae]|nr:hypothetical protein [Mycobacterium leprae]